MKHPFRVRLSVIMFLHYFSAGITLPIMSLYLSQELGFGGTGAGLILSVSALSAILAPMVGSFVTDRLVSAERLFSLLEIGAGLFMFLLWLSSSFTAVLLFYLLYMSMLVPAMALSNTIVFHHSPDQGSSFGGVRLWGTVGWVAAGWLFSYFWIDLAGGSVTEAPVFTSLAAVALGVFALSLPRGEGKAPRRAELVPRAALRVLMRPEISLLLLVAFIMQVTHRMYYFGTGPYLRQLGFPDGAILPALSAGQITEVAAMLLLPFVFRRFAYRTIILFGTITELLRFSAFFFWSSPVSAIVGIMLHGPTYTFFFIVSFIYLNSHADKESRAGVQQLFILLAEGAGAFGGSLLAGVLYDAFSTVPETGLVDYQRFWGVPVSISLVSISLMVVLNVLVRRRGRAAPGVPPPG